MVIGRDAAEFWPTLNFFITCYRHRDLTVFFRNIRASEMKIIVNVDLDLHFQGNLLQELNEHTQCDYFGENLMLIGWMVS